MSAKSLFRGFVLVWVMTLISWVTYSLFNKVQVVDANALSAYGLAIGLLATVIGLYKWLQVRDARRRGGGQHATRAKSVDHEQP